MPRNRYRKLGLVAILSLSGADSMAQDMPALRVDPTLLGASPVAKESTAGPETPVITPVQQDTVGVPSQEKKASTKAATPPAATTKKPTATTTSAPASTPTKTPSPAASTATKPAPPVVTPAATTVPTTAAPPSPAPSTPTKMAAPELKARPCVPVATSQTRIGSSGPAAPANKMPSLRVDPALLGAPPATPRLAPDVAIECQDDATQLAAAPRAARRAGGVALSSLPKNLPRIPIGKPDETTIIADNIRGNNETEVIAEGNVELAKDDALLEADHLVYRQPLDEAEATGNVRLSRDTEEMVGPYMKLQVKAKTGYFDQPAYVIQRSVIGSESRPKPKPTFDLFGLSEPTPKPPAPGRGNASRLHFEGDGHYRMEDATFSTCTPDAGGSLDWYTKVSNLKLDYTTATGTGTNTTVYFKDVPILYTPYIEFPLNDQRKSGLLAPTIGSSTNGGFEYTQPYYWNIAPNMDATIAPHIMSKRGVQLQNEFRYLQPDYSGIARAEYLPTDDQTGESRHAYVLSHSQNFGYGFSGNLALTRVSDDDYIRDFGTTTQPGVKDVGVGLGANNPGLLLSQGTLSYGAGWWSANLLVQDFQVLSTAEHPVAEPYEMKPKLSLSSMRADLPGGLQWNFNGETVNFEHSTNRTGNRTTLYPQISLPLQTAAFFVTPKFGYHQTNYSLDTLKYSNGTSSPGYSPSRGVPIASVDSGMFMERDTQWFGRSMVQTLEPRLYYVYIPNKDQNDIPLFDTALPDFNFATIFQENRYAGGDRIGDANQVTGMLSSRLIDPDSGAELIRVGLGQRVYFNDYEVKLSPTENTSRTDLLATFSGHVLPRIFIDSSWQYSQDLSRTERYNVGLRYQPEIGKVLNASYRYTDPSYVIVVDPSNPSVTSKGVDQVDFSGQWPLGGGWYGVGRYNYSFSAKGNNSGSINGIDQNDEEGLINAVAGLEYDGGCWIVRGVMQRSATSDNDYNTSFFMQLELKDFSRIGSNPMNLLKRSVGGYRDINSLGSDPTFATP